MTYRGHRGLNLTPIWVLIGLNLLLLLAYYINRGLILHLFGLRLGNFWSQPWTIVTSMFIHGGFGHFAVNMLTLYFFGTFLSMLVGKNKFLLVYFGGGILSGIFYLLLGPSSIPAVGASGAIFALGGVLAVMRPNLRVLVFFIIPAPLWLAVIGGFLILTLLSLLPLHIAWQAHLGGLILGLIAGYFFRKRERRTF